MKQKQIPCYVPDGGVHNVVNVPMGIFTRAELRKLIRELLANWRKFETMVVAPATPRTLKLLQGLDNFLQHDLKLKSSRKVASALLSANEKNLKPRQREQGTDFRQDMLILSLQCGLVVILFLLAAHLEYLEHLQ